MTNFLIDGPDDGPILLIAHGSGAPMDSVFMNEFSKMAGTQGIKVMRFEFVYMAGRRTAGKKPPPPKAEKLISEFMAVLESVTSDKSGRDIYIGGKSLGGRVASMMAQDCFGKELIKGLVCLGYPFHPPGKPGKLRTAHFEHYNCPSLICQGENDPFGKRPEVETYRLPESFTFHWAPFGNHDLAPPKRSGLTAQDNWQEATKAVRAFIATQNYSL